MTKHGVLLMHKMRLIIYNQFLLIVITIFSTNFVTADPVWKCISASGKTRFQSSPCIDSDTSQEQLDISKGNTIVGVPVGTPIEHAVTSVIPKNKQHSSPQNNQNKLSLSTCLKYRYELDKIDAEMRAGYSVRRGERLKLRRRHLDSLLWRHCK